MTSLPVKNRNRLALGMRIAAAAGALFLLTLLTGFLATPPLVRHLLEQTLAGKLQRPVALGQIRFDPLTLTLTLHRLQIAGEDGSPFLAAGEIGIDLQAASLWRRAAVIRALRVVGLDVRLVRDAAGRFNVSDLLAAQASDNSADPPFPFRIELLEVSGGQLRLEDGLAGALHRLEAMTLRLAGLSSLPGERAAEATAGLSAQFDGAPLDLRITAAPFAEAGTSSAALRIEGLDLRPFLPYLPALPELDIRSARLSLAQRFELHKTAHRNASPYRLAASGTIALQGVEITRPGGAPWLSLPLLEADLAAVDFEALRFDLRRVTLTEPVLDLLRRADGTLDLPLRPADPPPAGGTGSPPPRVVLKRLEAIRASLRYEDRSLSPPLGLALFPLDLTVEGWDTAVGAQPATVSLQAAGDGGEALRADGTLRLDPLSADIRLALEKIPLARYAAYASGLPGMPAIEGELALQVRVGCEADRWALSEGGLGLRDVRLFQGGTPLAAIDRLRLTGAGMDPQAQRIVLGEIESDGGWIALRRNSRGTLDLPGVASRAETAPAEQSEAHGRPWEVALPRLALSAYRLCLRDDLPGRSIDLQLDQLALRAEGFSTRPGARTELELRFRWGATGTVSVQGSTTADGGDLDLAVRVAEVDLPPLQPYLDRLLALEITSGRLHCNGRLSVAAAQGARFSGQAAISDFQSRAVGGGQPFLDWRSFFIDGMALSWQPLRLSAQRVALSDFHHRLAIDPRGSTNWSALRLGAGSTPTDGPSGDGPPAAGDGAMAGGSPEAEGRPAVGIQTLTLQGGRIEFSDRFIIPHVQLRMLEVGGHLSGFDSRSAEPAELLLRGRLGRGEEVEISGRLHPLQEKPFLDLKLGIAGIDLSPLAPYAGKYLGYGLEKGQLSLNLTYRLEQNRLEGRNRVFLNQFTLGDPVVSREATRLPVKLAVALLKDRSGDIHLELPVAGSLDNPEFSLGRTILRMLTNLVETVVTSPFKALGGLFGAGEELEYLDFEPGAGAIDGAGRERLDTLARILSERPELRLEIESLTDPERDRAALRQARLERLLQAAAGGTDSAASGLQWTREAALREAYTAAGFAKPRDSAGEVKALTVQEMEKLLLTAIAVEESDLRLLGLERAAAAKDYLQRSAGSERLFIVEPRSETLGGPAAPRSAVRFRLK